MHLMTKAELIAGHPCVDWENLLDMYRKLGKWVCEGYNPPINPEPQLLCVSENNYVLFPKCLFEEEFVPFEYATALHRQPAEATGRYIIAHKRKDVPALLKYGYDQWILKGHNTPS